MYTVYTGEYKNIVILYYLLIRPVYTVYTVYTIFTTVYKTVYSGIHTVYANTLICKELYIILDVYCDCFLEACSKNKI